MPTVPQYQRQSQTQTAPVMTSNLRVPENPLVQGIQQAADTSINMMADAKRKADVALSQDALLQFNQFGDDQFNNPDNGLITKQGKAALGQSDVVMQNMQQKAQDLLGTVPDGEARQQLSFQLQQSMQSFHNQARRYEVGQFQQFQDQQFSAIKQNVVTQSQGLYGDDAAFVNTVKMGFDAIEQYAAAHGWSQEQVVAEKEKLKEQAADSALSTAASQQYIQFMQQNGEPGDNEGAPRVTAHGNSSAARGLRNNNPGNIEAGSNSWDGQAGSDGRFAKFVTPEHGIRALGKNLLSYQRQGYDTVSEIVNRWAPASDGNNTEAYIAALCKKLNVTPNDQLNMSDINTLRQLCAGIIQHENGKQPYSEDQLNTGVSAALGLTTLESPKRYSGNQAFDAASPQQQAAYLRQSMELRNQARTQFKAQLVDQVQDATAAYLKGIQFDNPPSQGDFINAFGYREGTQRFNDFENLRVAGQYIGSFRTMPTASIQQYVSDLKNQVGNGEGLAGRAVAFDHVQAAADEVIKQRKADPIQFSLSSGQTKPIDMSNQNNFGQSIGLRASQVSELARAYGTPLTFFSKEEESQIGKFFRDAPVSQQSAYLDTIHKSTGGGKPYMAALQQISANAPSAAVAGILMDKPGGVVAEKNWFNPDVSVSPSTASQTILAGAAARKGSKEAKGITMPKENDMRLEFSNTVKDAFAGDAQGASMAYDVAKDYYAGVMAQKGDLSGELDSDVWEQAINVATGGVHDYNGMGNVLLPWGMSSEQFDKEVNQAWETQVTGAGVKAPPGQYGLQSYGDSQYLVKLGTGYLLKQDGTPVVIDLTQQRQRFSGDIPQ
ncbi:bacteriophage protein [Klebsiella pneumoniae]|uniref:Bacteriophage protein n=1 Tax=Klebsiella pneumoniae TaxID=573 RepID=A0A378BYD7_KLEPN|nr:bacteriophage protein [Klebsiella pneumoniae]STU29610.1 bacteriophage protein [Klebsiella pneumoniae]STU52774.1 bacteriophage protein [Klebsiella pneumoniae]STV56370.1 bacteriophage protein [Klebsiella pneumoniae]